MKVKEIIESKLFKGAGIYGISSFINAAIPFLLLPLLTRKLTPADYGVVTMFTTFQGYLIPFIGLNLENAITRTMYKKNEDVDSYISNCVIIYSFISFFSILVIAIFSNYLSALLSIPTEWIIYVPITCSLSFWSMLVLRIWQFKQQAFKYGIFQIFQTLANALMSLIFIIILNMNWKGRLLAIIISTFIFSLYSFYVIIKKYNIKLKINKTYFLHAIKFGAGLLPHSFGVMLLLSINRFFILDLISIEEAGLYMTAQSIVVIFIFFISSFNNAYVPWLYKQLNKNNLSSKVKIVKYTYYYGILLFCLGSLFYFFLPLMFKYFIGYKFSDAYKYCSWLILGTIFQGMYFMVTNLIVYSEKTFIQSIITISIGIINAFISYFLIKQYGLLGVGVSFAFGYFLFFLVTWYVSNKIYKMPWFTFNTNQE